MAEEKLMPCPFCGATPEHDGSGAYHLGEETRFIKCENVQCRVHPSIYQSQDEAYEWDLVDAWNERA